MRRASGRRRVCRLVRALRGRLRGSALGSAVGGRLSVGLGALAGFVVQWREWGRQVAACLTVVFAMPTLVLLLLLNFDYDSLSKHVFHVYPLPAYGVAALWMGLGFGWVACKLKLRPAYATGAALALVAAILALGSRSNFLADYDWAARYAKAVLRTLPKDATVFVRGDPDLNPIAYFHMIEGWRPDITLYQPGGLILGNRLFHPLRTDAATARSLTREHIERAGDYRRAAELFADLGLLVGSLLPQAEVILEENSTDKRNYRVSGQKARELLGFVPRKRLHHGILEIAEALSAGRISDPHLPHYNNLAAFQKAAA
mgnify:CR=1 FL=1